MTVLTFGTVSQDIKSNINFADKHEHNIFIILYVLPNFRFTASERKPGYY